MHDFGLLREALANVSRWQGKRVIVYVDPVTFSKEKYSSPIIRDVALLFGTGINMVFSCLHDGSAEFVRKAAFQGLNVVLLDMLADLVPLAERLDAVKVFLLCENDGIYDQRRHMLVREATVQDAEKILESDLVSGQMLEKLQLAVHLCRGHVERAHLVSGLKEGALLDEFLSGKGSGTMIYRDDPPYKTVRKAVSDDAVSIAHMIRDTVDSSIVEEVVQKRIGDSTVFVVDGHIHAAALSSFADHTVKIEYLAHSNEFDASEVLSALLRHIIDEAAKCGATGVVVDPNRVSKLIGIWPWFLGLGFHKTQSPSNKNEKWWRKEL